MLARHSFLCRVRQRIILTVTVLSRVRPSRHTLLARQAMGPTLDDFAVGVIFGVALIRLSPSARAVIRLRCPTPTPTAGIAVLWRSTVATVTEFRRSLALATVKRSLPSLTTLRGSALTRAASRGCSVTYAMFRRFTATSVAFWRPTFRGSTVTSIAFGGAAIALAPPGFPEALTPVW